MIFRSGPVCTPCAPRSAQGQAPGVTGTAGGCRRHSSCGGGAPEDHQHTRKGRSRHHGVWSSAGPPATQGGGADIMQGRNSEGPPATQRGMHTLCGAHTSWGVGVELRRTLSNIHSQMWGGEGSGGTTPQEHRELSSLRSYRQGNDGRKGETGEVDEAQFLPETLQNAPQWNDCF